MPCLRLSNAARSRAGIQAGRPNPGRRMRADPTAIAGAHVHEAAFLQHGCRSADRGCRGSRVLQKIGRQDMPERAFGKWEGFRVGADERRLHAGFFQPLSGNDQPAQGDVDACPMLKQALAGFKCPAAPAAEVEQRPSTPAARKCLERGYGSDRRAQCVLGEDRRKPRRNVLGDRIVKSNELAKIVALSEFMQPRRLGALILERQITIAAQAEVGNAEQDGVDAVT